MLFWYSAYFLKEKPLLMDHKYIERTVCDYVLVILLIIYVIFAIGILVYIVYRDKEGHKAGMTQMLNDVGIGAQYRLLYASTSLMLFASVFFVLALCLTPRWGCYYLLGVFLLLISLAIHIYIIIVTVLYHWKKWGVENYLMELDYDTEKGRRIWDNLQIHLECCGVLDEDEWDHKPPTCPDFHHDDGLIHGCSPKFEHSQKKHTFTMVMLLFIFAILQILGVAVLYCILWPYYVVARQLRKEEPPVSEEEEVEEGEPREFESFESLGQGEIGLTKAKSTPESKAAPKSQTYPLKSTVSA